MTGDGTLEHNQRVGRVIEFLFTVADDDDVPVEQRLMAIELLVKARAL